MHILLEFASVMTTPSDYPDLCADIFTEESLNVIDGGSGDAECTIGFSNKGQRFEIYIPNGMKIKLGSNNTVEDGSEVWFKSGNGIVAKGSRNDTTEEATTTAFTLRARKGSKRPGKRRGKGQSFSMKLPQQVRIDVWHVLKLQLLDEAPYLKAQQVFKCQ